MTQKTRLFAPLAALILLGAGAGLQPTAQAQTQRPEATPIPLTTEAVPVAEEAPAPEPVKPAKAEAVTWTPSSGFLTPNAGKVAVLAQSTVVLDTSFGTYVLGDAGNNFGPEQNAVKIFTNGNKNVSLEVTLPTSGNFTKIQFFIKDTNNTSLKLESPIFSIGRRLYMPLMQRDFFFPPLNLDQTEPNNGSCSAAGTLTSGRTYNGQFSSTDEDWVYIDIAQAGSSLRITGSTFPVPSQLQAYAVASTNCNGVSGSPTGSIADTANPILDLSNLPAGRVFIRMAGTSATPLGSYSIRVDLNNTSGSFEPNNTPCQATKTVAGVTYTTVADDAYDFFEMDVPESGTLKLTVTEYPESNQLQLRSPIKDSACSATTSTDRIGDAAFIVSGKAEISAFVNKGVYFARMGDNTLPSPTGNYKFVWTFTAGQQPPKVDSCNRFFDCFGDSTGGKFQVFWRSMPANTEITVNFRAQTTTGGGCPSGAASANFDDTFNVGSVSNGQRDYARSIPRGYYAVSVNAKSGGTIIHSNQFPIKMDCTFLTAADAEAQPTPAP
jgi:hypothetical protein